jgi:outer membrane protein OmpA-like peptidoglycan-associated protein
MRIHKVVFPLVALTALGLAGVAATGCHAEATAKVGGTEPPPPPPPPPPASSTAEAPPPPPPPPPKKVIALKGVQMKSPTQIDIKDDVEFQSGSAKIALNDKSKKVLALVATILKDNPERAQSVADFLTKNGVDAGRLNVVGWGSEHPLQPNDTPAHMAENRRTEFHVETFNGQAVESDAASAPSAGAPAASASASAAASAAPASSAAAAKKK